MSFPQRRGVSGLHPVLTAPGGGVTSFTAVLAQTTPLEVVSFSSGTAGGLLLRSFCISGGGSTTQTVWIEDLRGSPALVILGGYQGFTLLDLFVPATLASGGGNTVSVVSNQSGTIAVNLTYDLITQPYSIN